MQVCLASEKNPSLLDRLQGRTQLAPADFRMLGHRRGTIAMHAKDWKPVAAGAN